MSNKQYFLLIILLIGVFILNLFNKSYDDYNCYVLVDSSIIDSKNNYLGISTKYSNIDKVMKIYKNNNLIIKKEFINNNEFIKSLEQYDILLNDSSNNDEIKSINDSILSTYYEIIIGNN